MRKLLVALLAVAFVFTTGCAHQASTSTDGITAPVLDPYAKAESVLNDVLNYTSLAQQAEADAYSLKLIKPQDHIAIQTAFKKIGLMEPTLSSMIKSHASAADIRTQVSLGLSDVQTIVNSVGGLDSEALAKFNQLISAIQVGFNTIATVVQLQVSQSVPAPVLLVAYTKTQ